MYKALYEFEKQTPECLSFRAGDRFTVIDRINQDWFLAQNGLGQIGYVPEKYIKPIEAEQDQILKFVDSAIEAIHLQSTDGEQCSAIQQQNLQKLVKHRNDLEKSFHVRPPLEKSQSSDFHRRPSEKHRPAPTPPHVDIKKKDKSHTYSSENHKVDQTSPHAEIEGKSLNERKTCCSELQATAPPLIETSLSIKENTSSISSPDNVQNQDHEKQLTLGMTELTPSLSVETCEESKQPSSKKTPAPKPPEQQDVIQSVASSGTNGDNSLIIHASVSEQNPLTSDEKGIQKLSISQKVSLAEVAFPDKIGPELIEEVRKNTGLSFDKSKIAVETVMGYIGFKIPTLEGVVDKILASLHLGRDLSDEHISSHDAQRLTVIFAELTACKEDSQQRSWALHEDEVVIREYLEELLSILENAKPSICRKVVARENYEILHHLVQYYQMELRPGLCQLLLKVFIALCALQKEVLTQLLYSVLPLELAQQLKAHSDDVYLTSYIAIVMTLIFSMGDPVPLSVSEELDQDFFLHVLQLMENPPSIQFEDEVVEPLVHFILSYNLHLTSESNPILGALAAFGSPKVFTEQIMVLINRGKDPVRVFDYKPQPPNSVLKLFHDLFSDSKTSELLYTNDAKVLIDVIIRHLTNLSQGDKIRSSFLTLCQLVVRSSTYSEHKHHVKDLHQCLLNIQNEEVEVPDDKIIASEILAAHPDLFA